ncbi:uncharacterized protein [Ptychodera flava]|uniref:uncharacterized protein isoform X3 n=1 Tax=Ptychodera flava TaxID=63121 RepID=UPI003969D15B
MDGGEEQEIPKAREMGQQTCHVLQNTDVHRQRLLIAFENLKPPDDPSKSSQEICGWLPDTKVQYRKVDKGKQNNSGRPVSGKKARQINPREHFQFIHYSDPRKYIEQYRRLHTCGGPLEKLRQGHCGREKEIYYAPFEHQHGTTINVNSKNLQGHCSKCMRLEPPSTLQTKFPLNYYLPYSPRETNITFEIQARPSVSQYKAVYNTNTGITYEANDHAQAQNSGSGGSSSRESSAETPEKYSFHNGSVVALPRPRLYVATSTTTPTTTNNSTTMSNSRSTSRQSPPQNGFSIDRSLGKVTSTTGHTQTEYDRASYDMTATGYNIMTVDRKVSWPRPWTTVRPGPRHVQRYRQSTPNTRMLHGRPSVRSRSLVDPPTLLWQYKEEQESLPRERVSSATPGRPQSQGNLPIAVGVKVQQTPRAQSAHAYRRPSTAIGRTFTRQKTWSASTSTVSTCTKDFSHRRLDTGNGHVPSICEGMWFDTTTGKAYMSLSTRYVPARKW